LVATKSFVFGIGSWYTVYMVLHVYGIMVMWVNIHVFCFLLGISWFLGFFGSVVRDVLACFRVLGAIDKQNGW